MFGWNKKEKPSEPTFEDWWRERKTLKEPEGPRPTTWHEMGSSGLKSAKSLLPHSLQSSIPSFGSRPNNAINTGSSSGTSQFYVPYFIDKAMKTTALLMGSSSTTGQSFNERPGNAMDTTSIGIDPNSVPTFEEGLDNRVKTKSTRRGSSSGT